VEVVASLSQGRTAAAQCGLFTHKSFPVIFEPPCIYSRKHSLPAALSVVFLSPHVQMCSPFSASDLGHKHSNSAQFSSVACFECSCFVCLMRPCQLYVRLCRFDHIRIQVVNT